MTDTFRDREERIIKRYNELKEKKARLDERKAMCMESLKREFGIVTEEDLELQIRKTKAERDKLVQKIEPALDKLERDLGL